MVANSSDLDEMPCFAALHLGPVCLPKYQLGFSSTQRVKLITSDFYFQNMFHACFILSTNLVMNNKNSQQ